MEITDTENDIPQQVDTKCMAVPTCVANSSDYRKIVSHIFGRNKNCTRQLPNNLWIFWCRKHYQRMKYRGLKGENWHTMQMALVRKQLQIFENWGNVQFWDIALRKAENKLIVKENGDTTTHDQQVSPCWERFLEPYLGENKTFDEVRQVLSVIEYKFHEPEYLNRAKERKVFPGVEFLASLSTAREVKEKKPAEKKGKAPYKKITLNQPTMIRKTQVNKDIKKMAAKHGQVLNSSKDKAHPNKRRRYLTRGYEKHASDSETTTLIMKKKETGKSKD